MGAMAFMRATKERTIFVIYAMLVTESVNGFEALPIGYNEYQDVFEKKNAYMLLQHRLYNCAISLQENTQLPFGPIYNLFQNKFFCRSRIF
jgi:hypothetical protein